MRFRPFAVAPLLGLSIGCLGPLASDTPGYSPHILRPDLEPPPVTDDRGLTGQIDMKDNVTSPVVPRVGYAAGMEVRFLDFGTAPNTGQPVYRLVRCGEDGWPLPDGDIAHPRIVDAVPGDPFYSPFQMLWDVCVTDAYADQRITSLVGIADAIELGLMFEPAPTTSWYNAPGVLPDVVLDLGPEQQLGPTPVYYRDHTAYVAGFDGASAPLQLGRSRSTIPNAVVYLLEKADDMTFSQVIFATPRERGGMPVMGYSPLVLVVRLVMDPAYVAGTIRDSTQLVMGTPPMVMKVEGAPVVMVKPQPQTAEYRNYEILRGGT